MHVQYEGKDLEAMAFAPNYYSWVLGLFRPYIGKRVAEVGAGLGNFSSLLVAEGPEELVVVEPSQEMYPLLKQTFHANAKVVCLQALFADICVQYTEAFDTVVYVNVLEHVEHDAQELDYMYKSLKKGGFVCIFVPALPSLYSDFDASVGHYRRYTKNQLGKMLEQAGFEIVKISYFDFFGILPWFILFKLLRLKLGAGSTSTYDTFVVPISRIVESWISVPVGKNVLVIGKKN